MTLNHPISGHFCLILGQFPLKSSKNHGGNEFDLPILAPFSIRPAFLTKLILKIEKHGFQTNSGTDQNGQ